MPTIDEAVALIESLAPQGRPVPFWGPLQQDEADWFVRSASPGVIAFDECPATPRSQTASATSRPQDVQLGIERRCRHHLAARHAQTVAIRHQHIRFHSSEAPGRTRLDSLDSAQVIAELVDLAKHLQTEADRGYRLGLGEDELAFYDAVRSNDSAVLELGDDTLKHIAGELVGIVRRDAKTDWAVKEQVRAQLRRSIKRLLRRHKYPPDQQDTAVQLVLQQAEAIAADWAAA